MLSSYVFQDNALDAREDAIAQVEASGAPQEQIDIQIKAIEAMTSPGGQATSGAVGTFFTSLISGAIIAIFRRKK